MGCIWYTVRDDVRRCQIIVDTSSNVSIVHSDIIILKRAGLDVFPTSTAAGWLWTVTGEMFPPLGGKTVQLTVDTFQTPHTMWVSVSLEWQAHKCLQSISRKRFFWTARPTCYRCCAKSLVTLPPCSKALIAAQVGGEWKLNGRWAVLQPETTDWSSGYIERH